MEFKEFSNPESKDYDINMSLRHNDSTGKNYQHNQYTDQLLEKIGLIEDMDDEKIKENYGITFDEYLHPTAEIIEKVDLKLSQNKEETSVKK